MQPLVIVADRIAQEGLDLLGEQCHVATLDTLGNTPLAEHDVLADAEGLIVRSETRVNADLSARAPKLRVIGRAWRLRVAPAGHARLLADD